MQSLPMLIRRAVFVDGWIGRGYKEFKGLNALMERL